MHLNMDSEAISLYKSKAQQARVVTEKWVATNAFCPNCAGKLENYANNSPVADLFCALCSEDFELKATSKRFGKSIPDGAYNTMINRLYSRTNPNLMLLQYDTTDWSVTNFAAIPKYFFTPDIILKRPPLALTARRAGWIGCNILIGRIPADGFIKIVTDKEILRVEDVTTYWHKTTFLKNIKNIESRGWLLETMRCINAINKKQFTLTEVYQFENSLQDLYPNNRHIKDKLRQQLQILRDAGYLNFIGRGNYELSS